VGASTLLVAGRLCRERRAMLIVDPPSAWKTAMEAVEGLREWPFRSENARMYFPRMLCYDRLRGRFEQFAPCGAVAGMLARADEACPIWSAIQGDEPILRPGYRPEFTVEEPMRLRLMQLGINVLQAVRSVSRVAPSARTLAGPGSAASDWKYLSARRLALFIVDSIERGTRWVVFETNGPALWLRVFEQVDTFLAELDRDGAFIGRSPEDAYVVVCDERINVESDGTLNILVGFAAARAGEFHSYLISHQAAGSRVRPVTINRLESGGRTLEEEMEEWV
jgi:phage tail sheath protein FI